MIILKIIVKVQFALAEEGQQQQHQHHRHHLDGNTHVAHTELRFVIELDVAISNLSTVNRSEFHLGACHEIYCSDALEIPSSTERLSNRWESDEHLRLALATTTEAEAEAAAATATEATTESETVTVTEATMKTAQKVTCSFFLGCRLISCLPMFSNALCASLEHI